ncbi:hypothetical protein C8Q75DRAFT_893647 [Abortiporus biennis]|nr:hypothetical protein C8Q75DRAFT_893647 [Abortiporus biennis]
MPPRQMSRLSLLSRYDKDLGVLTTTVTTPPITNINSLPEELLVKIIRLALRNLPFKDKDQDRLYHISLNRYAHVCSYWRSILLDVPMLWTKVNLSRSIDCAETYLTRSKGLLIRTTASISSDKVGKSSEVDIRQLEVIRDHAYRISSLVLYVNKVMTANSLVSQFLLEVSFPHLERLEVSGKRFADDIEAQDEDDDPEFESAFIFKIPTQIPLFLKQLRIKHIAVPWNYATFTSRLTTLEIVGQPQNYELIYNNGTSTPSFNKFLDILEHCSNLEILRLIRFIFCSHADRHSILGHGADRRIIRLNRLRIFHIEETSDQINTILNHFHFLPYTSISIQLVPVASFYYRGIGLDQILPVILSRTVGYGQVQDRVFLDILSSVEKLRYYRKKASLPDGRDYFVVQGFRASSTSPSTGTESVPASFTILSEYPINRGQNNFSDAPFINQSIPVFFNRSSHTLRHIKLSGFLDTISHTDWFILFSMFPFIETLSLEFYYHLQTSPTTSTLEPQFGFDLEDDDKSEKELGCGDLMKIFLDSLSSPAGTQEKPMYPELRGLELLTKRDYHLYDNVEFDQRNSRRSSKLGTQEKDKFLQLVYRYLSSWVRLRGGRKLDYFALPREVSGVDSESESDQVSMDERFGLDWENIVEFNVEFLNQPTAA